MVLLQESINQCIRDVRLQIEELTTKKDKNGNTDVQSPEEIQLKIHISGLEVMPINSYITSI